MNSQKIAKLLSIILGPHVWLLVFLSLFVFKSGLSSAQLTILFPIMAIFQVIVPLAYLYIAPRVGLATSWDLPHKKEHRLFILITLISNLIALFFIFKFGNKLVIDLNLIFLVMMAVIFGLTPFWKVSHHAAVNTFGTLLTNFLFGWQLPWLYILIPTIYWARLILKRHTHLQLLAGIGISALIFLGGLKILGYL